MHARYFGDNVVFFRIDSIHPPSPGCGCGSAFYFAHRIIGPKRDGKP
jgi:hypothetical protein